MSLGGVCARGWRRYVAGFAAAALVTGSAVAQMEKPVSARPDLDFPTVLYGAAYYNEYMPGDQQARLEKDVAMMKAAGLNVVRMGESTWSLKSEAKRS